MASMSARKAAKAVGALAVAGLAAVGVRRRLQQPRQADVLRPLDIGDPPGNRH